MNTHYIKNINPPNYGWLEYKLDTQEMDYVWKCIENKKELTKNFLAVNIDRSYNLMDSGRWFESNVIRPMCQVYSDKYGNLGDRVPNGIKHPYYMRDWWVNYQKKHEFNPLHNHSGVYSFVIWMKIPTTYEEQRKNHISSNSNSNTISNFQMWYNTTTGAPATYTYGMFPERAGMMLFFPATMHHCVYPFYNCDEERITVSGNVLLNTTRK